MKLQHENLSDFEPVVRNICDAAFATGMKVLKTQGRKFEDVKTDYKLFKTFVSHCHKGYDNAQKMIADEIIRLWKLKKQKQAELREKRNQGNKEALSKINEFISIIDNRIIVLRRIIDSIAFTLLEGTWVTRRFMLFNKMKDIDIDAIRTNLIEARFLNSQDRLTFSLVCDLTTFIDVGDLIQINFRKSPREWQIIEIKKGRVNKILGDLIEEKGASLSEEEIKKLAFRVSKSAPEQINRMIKQKIRMDRIIEIVKTGEGIDITGMPLKLSEEEIETSTYNLAIEKVIKQAKVNGFSILLIDKCLILLATKYSIFESLHILYHFLFPSQRCGFLYNRAEEREGKEIETLAASHFIVDLINDNFYARASTPFLISFPLDNDTFLDLIFDRLKILAYLDIPRFKKLCLKKGFNFELCSRKETEKLKQKFGKFLVPLYNNRAIRVKTPRGREIQLLGGALHRIFFDLWRPVELIREWEIYEKEIIKN